MALPSVDQGPIAPIPPFRCLKGSQIHVHTINTCITMSTSVFTYARLKCDFAYFPASTAVNTSIQLFDVETEIRPEGRRDPQVTRAINQQKAQIWEITFARGGEGAGGAGVAQYSTAHLALRTDPA